MLDPCGFFVRRVRMKLKIFTFCGKSVILENKRNLRRSKEAFEFQIRYVYENIRKIQRHFTFVYGIIKQEYDQRKGVYANEYFVFETAYLYDDCSLRQAIEKIEYHKYTAVPVLNKKGCYVGTLTEGDLLRIIKERYLLNYHEAEDIPLWQVPKRWNYESVNINSNIEDLIEMSMRQNFVPVVDDEGIFIGIIRRRDIIQYCYQKSGIKEEEEARRSARKQNAEQMILQ